MALERKMEQSIKPVLVEYADWLSERWKDEIDQISMKLKVQKQLPSKEFEQWASEFGKNIQEPMGLVMDLGAIAGVKDLPGVSVDWSLENIGAQKWLKYYSSTLANTVFTTSFKEMTDSLATGLSLGEDMYQLSDRVKSHTAMIKQWKAMQIAQTETIRSYTQGSLLLYKQSGVVERKIWLDGQMGACPLCQGLSNKVSGLDGFFKGTKEDVSGPPAHPSCRCSIAPYREGWPLIERPSFAPPEVPPSAFQFSQNYLKKLVFSSGNNSGISDSWILQTTDTGEKWFAKIPTYGNHEILNELVSYRIGQELGLKMPAVKIIKKLPANLIGGADSRLNKTAVLMQDWKNIEPTYKFNTMFNTADNVQMIAGGLDNAREVSKMPYFDFLLDNTDRHGGNWLVGSFEAEEGKRYYIGLINNSLTLNGRSSYSANEIVSFNERNLVQQKSFVKSIAVRKSEDLYYMAKELGIQDPELIEEARKEILQLLKTKLTESKIKAIITEAVKELNLTETLVDELSVIITDRREMLLKVDGAIF